eukprot:gene20095-20636_t
MPIHAAGLPCRRAGWRRRSNSVIVMFAYAENLDTHLDISGDTPTPGRRLGGLVAGAGRIAGALALALQLTCTAQAQASAAARLPVVASAAAIATDGPVTRFTMRLSAPVGIESFVLADPYRVVVELPEVGFDVAGAKREPKGLV